MGIGVGRLQFQAVLQLVSLALCFSGAASRLRGAKPHAHVWSEKMR